MRIEDSERFPSWKKVVIDPGEADGLETEVLEDYAVVYGATKLAAGKDEYILQFPGEEETVWRRDQLEDALNLHCS